MAKKILLLTVVSVIVFLGYGTISYAQDQRLKTSKPASQDVSKDKLQIEKIEPKSKPEAVRVLQTDIKSLTQFVPLDRKSLIEAMKKSIEKWHESRDFKNKFPGIGGGYYGEKMNTLYYSYKSRSQNCLDRSYSVQDQQAAGCLGSDTVSQCADKLYFWCMKQYEPLNHFTELMLELHNLIQLLNETNKNLQDISNKLNNKQY